MAGKYRHTRNIEASLIDFIKIKLEEDGWKSINVEKSFARVYKLQLPVILIKVPTTNYEKLEVGSNIILRNPVIYIEIFGSDDGNKLDLKDWVIDTIKNGFDYYEYTIEKQEDGGKVTRKDKVGYVFIRRITETEVNLGVDKSSLDEHDRYRTLLTINATLNYIQ